MTAFLAAIRCALALPLLILASLALIAAGLVGGPRVRELLAEQYGGGWP